MATTNDTLDEAKRRLKVRGDTFLDSDGKRLLRELEQIASHDADAAKSINEIKHRRSETIE